MPGKIAGDGFPSGIYIVGNINCLPKKNIKLVAISLDVYFFSTCFLVGRADTHEGNDESATANPG